MSSIDSQTGYVLYHQRRRAIRPKTVVKDKVDANLNDNKFELIIRGETPAGDPVALVKVEDGLGAPVLVLIVNNEVSQIWDGDAQADATSVFQKTVVLGTGVGR